MLACLEKNLNLSDTCDEIGSATYHTVPEKRSKRNGKERYE